MWHAPNVLLYTGNFVIPLKIVNWSFIDLCFVPNKQLSLHFLSMGKAQVMYYIPLIQQ